MNALRRVSYGWLGMSVGFIAFFYSTFGAIAGANPGKLKLIPFVIIKSDNLSAGL